MALFTLKCIVGAISGQIQLIFTFFVCLSIVTYSLTIPTLVSVAKDSHASEETGRQRRALRFKLDAASVWFSISTCHRRRAAGLMLSVTPNRWAPAL